MEFTYTPHGVCSLQILLELDCCGSKPTSCPDQLAKALLAAKEQQNG